MHTRLLAGAVIDELAQRVKTLASAHSDDHVTGLIHNFWSRGRNDIIVTSDRNDRRTRESAGFHVAHRVPDKAGTPNAAKLR